MGRAWIWNLAAEHYPAATQSVDRFHASERIWELGRALYGEGTATTAAWVDRQLAYLAAGQVSRLRRAGRRRQVVGAASEAPEAQATDFTNQAPRTADDRYRVRGLDVVEAACLAHDLGHPPFGHVAEEELDRLAQGKEVADGFEGNAQTFRILTRLAVRYRDVAGLNLTRATLCAALKYPWLRGDEGDRAKKWGSYSSEMPEFDFARHLLAAPGDDRSLEAELMDWADDVAYAVHDVEDFYRAGLIPLDKVSTDSIERDRLVAAELERNAKLEAYGAENLAQAFNDLLDFSPIFEPYRGSAEGRTRLRSFTSSLVDRYVKAVSLANDGHGTGKPGLAITQDARMGVAMLKGLTWQYVIESRALITQRYGQKRLIRSLFDTLCEAGASRTDRRIFPELDRDSLGRSPDDALVVRTVIDLISSMTEPQVVALHHRLAGVSLGAPLDPILP